MLLMLVVGCRGKDRLRESRLYHRIAQGGRRNVAQAVPGIMAAAGSETITDHCAHETYANASKGLIVEEAGLHEDVFSLRDLNSLAPNAYRLDEALRLEAMLRAEAGMAEHSKAQDDCIAAFAQHLGVLTDALIQADKLQKEMDASAYNDASKQAQEQEEQMEKTQRALDQIRHR